MIETLVALAVIAVLLSFGLVYRFVPWLPLLRGGAAIIVLGVAVSVMGGLLYHIALYRALQPRRALRHGWWWRPTDYHPELTAMERPGVLPWFYLGAFGFCVVMMGCVAVLLAVWRD